MTVYEVFGELPDGIRNWLQDALTDKEEFVVAVSTRTLIARNQPFFIVTDRRFLRYRKILFSEFSSDISFDHLTRVDWHERNFGRSGTLEIEGPSIDESHAFSSSQGKPLVDALRTQLAKRQGPA